MSKPAVFLDRDGVLNFDKGYTYRVEDLRVMDGVPQTLMTLKERGYLLIVVTNQSGVARGYFRLEDANLFNSALSDKIQELGGPAIDGFFVCPHYPEGKVSEYSLTCDCRKPSTGLLTQAVSAFDIELAHSYLIGDKPSDIDCGLSAGVFAIHLTNDEPHPQASGQITTFADCLPLIS
jgi:D-glycero-D-manno-heptose 1,7-bisphosphate phosphatase